MMGTGKTTAGALAAKRLEVDFVDTDEEMERRMGMEVSDLWASKGEEGFRHLEAEVVADVAGRTGVVATGGGAVLAADNREKMVGSGPVVWLQASPRIISTRLRGANRPLLAEGGGRMERIASLLEERRALYALVANHTIDTDGRDVTWVAGEIAAVWAD
jgi:shikimate kinase